MSTVDDLNSKIANAFTVEEAAGVIVTENQVQSYYVSRLLEEIKRRISTPVNVEYHPIMNGGPSSTLTVNDFPVAMSNALRIAAADATDSTDLMFRNKFLVRVTVGGMGKPDEDGKASFPITITYSKVNNSTELTAAEANKVMTDLMLFLKNDLIASGHTGLQTLDVPKKSSTANVFLISATGKKVGIYDEVSRVMKKAIEKFSNHYLNLDITYIAHLPSDNGAYCYVRIRAAQKETAAAELATRIGMALRPEPSKDQRVVSDVELTNVCIVLQKALQSRIDSSKRGGKFYRVDIATTHYANGVRYLTVNDFHDTNKLFDLANSAALDAAVAFKSKYEVVCLSTHSAVKNDNVIDVKYRISYASPEQAGSEQAAGDMGTSVRVGKDDQGRPNYNGALFTAIKRSFSDGIVNRLYKVGKEKPNTTITVNPAKGLKDTWQIHVAMTLRDADGAFRTTFTKIAKGAIEGLAYLYPDFIFAINHVFYVKDDKGGGWKTNAGLLVKAKAETAASDLEAADVMAFIKAFKFAFDKGISKSGMESWHSAAVTMHPEAGKKNLYRVAISGVDALTFDSIIAVAFYAFQDVTLAKKNIGTYKSLKATFQVVPNAQLYDAAEQGETHAFIKIEKQKETAMATPTQEFNNKLAAALALGAETANSVSGIFAAIKKRLKTAIRDELPSSESRNGGIYKLAFKLPDTTAHKCETQVTEAVNRVADDEGIEVTDLMIGNLTEFSDEAETDKTFDGALVTITYC
jgi:hypothetical protein